MPKVRGLHRNGGNTASNIIVAPFNTDDYDGLDQLIDSLPDDSGPADDEVNSKNHRKIFAFCQKAGAIPKSVKFEDGKLQFNPALGMIRFVSNDYCPMAESAETGSLDSILARMQTEDSIAG